MQLDKSDLYTEIDRFEVLPESINQISKSDFQRLFGSGEASNKRDLVYVFLAEKPIPRLLGESRIVYIGQTKRGIRERYFGCSNHLSKTKANKFKFETITENYGAITVAIHDYSRYGENLLKSEGQLLWWYFQNHGEYPPVNYTKTKVRRDVIEA